MNGVIDLQDVMSAFPHYTLDRAAAFLLSAANLKLTQSELHLMGGGRVALEGGRVLSLAGNGSGYWGYTIANNQGVIEHRSCGSMYAWQAAREVCALMDRGDYVRYATA